MNRPDFIDIYLKTAWLLSERSTCHRLKVGTVITSPDWRHIYSVGYNGNASGLNNGCDLVGEKAVGNCGCLHSEENAIINCDVPRYVEKVVICTHLPCVMCAKRIINLGGVMSVYYDKPYRITDSLSLFDKVAIEARQWNVRI